MAETLTARELLDEHKVRCRTCERDLPPTEVVVTERVWRDPDQRGLKLPPRARRTATLTLACEHCLEETSKGLLL